MWRGGRCRLTPIVFPVNRQGENAIRFRIGWLFVVTLALLAVPLAAEAQSAGKVPRLGYLGAGAASDTLSDAFRQGLRELGWIEGLLGRADEVIQ